MPDSSEAQDEPNDWEPQQPQPQRPVGFVPCNPPPSSERRALMEGPDIGYVVAITKPKELRTIECSKGRLVKETKDGQWVIVRNRHGKVPTYSAPFDDWDEACQDAMHHEPASA